MLESYIWNVLATVTGGAILTFIFFLLREKCFPIPNISGVWYVENTTESSAYNPYKGMTLDYIIMFWCEGCKVSGTAEKVHEDSVNINKDFIGKDRKRSNVNGYIQKNYFSKDKVTLHLVEDGFGRVSTYSYELIVTRKGMVGTFSSMVADQKGKSTWTRKKN
ncbi:hypothetical protein [Pseudoalteromonas sp. MMG007]|uniref:hypothetical protein n=1 Tax=Pseudoalteromonas sp. MMG007 TaxID=2822684 RepID=UPI001B3794E0|nr:hypothetical protein [Pseudoalteromonas sp. MMG007]MBQ4857040.1 hypothetical protein [Pseudoalteromonas sp. MMG007]